MNDRDRVLLLGLADGTLRGASARERALALAGRGAAAGAPAARPARAARRSCPAPAASCPGGRRLAPRALARSQALGSTRRPGRRTRGAPARAPRRPGRAVGGRPSRRARPRAADGALGPGVPRLERRVRLAPARRATRRARRGRVDDRLLRAHGSPARLHDPAGHRRASAKAPGSCAATGSRSRSTATASTTSPSSSATAAPACSRATSCERQHWSSSPPGRRSRRTDRSASSLVTRRTGGHPHRLVRLAGATRKRGSV